MLLIAFASQQFKEFLKICITAYSDNLLIRYANRTCYNEALLTCSVNLEDIILFIVALFECHGDLATVCAILNGNISELNTLDVIGANLPLKQLCYLYVTIKFRLYHLLYLATRFFSYL